MNRYIPSSSLKSYKTFIWNMHQSIETPAPRPQRLGGEFNIGRLLKHSKNTANFPAPQAKQFLKKSHVAGH